MMNFLSELSPEEQAAWHETMLAHSYDLMEWHQARNTLLHLLNSDQKKVTETSVCSYLSCCAEAVSGGYPLPDLCSTVKEFYQRFGMDNAQSPKE